MSNNQDFVIEQQKRTVVNDYKSKIEKLFNVRVKFANGGSADGMLWIGLTGDEEQRTKAKDYIKALTSPEQKCTVLIPDSLLPVLGANTKEHFELEAEYGVVVSFPEEKKALIAGSAVGVTCAASKLEDLIKENRGKTTNVAPKARGSEANPNRALEDFALKLGYEQAEITVVFEKLGGTIDRNTFLNELIKLSNQRSRAVEDRRSPIPVQGGGATFCSTYAREAYGRHPGDMVATKGLPSGGLNMMSGINARGFRPDTFIPDNGVVSRGVIPRATVQSSRTGSTPSPMYTNTNSDFNSLYPSNGSYMTAGNDFSQVAIDPRQLDQMYQDLMTNSVRKQIPQSDLRHIVIDGSNVAMSHGNNKVFSCKGIRLCVDWFRARGHKDITVFVPQWRKESAKRESPITDQHLLNQLEDQGYLKFTPSRRINGRRIVCYDDRFVVRLAENTDGIIVSNDNFKDLSQENPKWREVIESRLLMYSFVNDMFMPPDDPLGRDGPTLDEFLHKGMSNHHRRVCPYGRRCTYGTRCKYHHPEREDNRLPLYQTLKDMFPNQEALILSILKSYPQERDVQRLATMVLDKLS